MGLFPALPVRGHQDTTLNFEKTQREVNLDWVAPEGITSKLETTAGLGVRREWYRTVCRLKGNPKTKEAIPAGTTLFTLPAGFRPPNSLRVLGTDATAVGVLLLLVLTTGVVESEHEIAINHFLSFDGITFQLT